MTGRILLIEDNQKLAEMIRDYLSDSSLSVTIAGNGNDGLTLCKTQCFDAVILDLMNELQGNDMEAFDRSIDVHISRIRSEIEDNARQPRRIITIRGNGYIFARVQEDL